MSKFTKSSIVITLVVICCVAIPYFSGMLQKPIHPDALRLGVSQTSLERSPEFALLTDDFDTAEKGYGTLKPDSDGAGVIARCRDGDCISIQVVFGDRPVSRDVAMRRLRQLFPPNVQLVEHDDSELVNDRCPEPTEFFYFLDDYKAEIAYSKSERHKAVWVNVWYDRQHRDRG
jgi:hypothetical protein